MASAQMIDRSAELDKLCLVFVRDSRIRIVTRHEGLEDAIRSRLTYKHISWARGRPVSQQVACFEIDRIEGNNHYYTGVGFLPTIYEMATVLGCQIEVHDVNLGRLQDPILLPKIKMDIPKVEWDGMRSWQRDSIRFLRQYRRGRFGVATGSGKSWLIRKLCKYIPKARILIVAKGSQNLKDLYTPLALDGLDVQYIDGQSRSDPHARIICCTTGSLGRVEDIKFDVCLADEVHEHGSNKTCMQLYRVKTDRMFGFSANMEDRADGADIWVESIYGPVLVERSYQDNVAAGDVVQIKVRMIDMYTGPTSRSKLKASKDKLEIWTNDARNKAFADIAKHHMDEGAQVLILTSTTEHALNIRKFIDVPVVFRNPGEARAHYFHSQGLIRPGDNFSDQRNDQLSLEFAQRKIKCIIANSLWRQGKDFPSLDVLCRTDATTSAIPCTQANGRLSRTSPGKSYGKLYDSWDQFSEGRKANAKKRASLCRKQGWEFV